MAIQLSDHFTYKRLLRFTASPIAMMIFTSIYGVVDGLFVSNYVGSNALSSINIVMPMIMIVGAFGFMLGAGGSAEVAKALGEGKNDTARKYFTTLVITIISIGVTLSVILLLLINPICRLLGATDLLIKDCVTYGSIQLIGITFFMLQTSFQTFFVTAEKPKIGLILTVASGVTNMVLDYVFVALLDWGIAGAAWATITGYAIGGIIPLIYFLLPNGSLLRFVKTKPYINMLLCSCGNGSSEMVSNISSSAVITVFNYQMLRIVGEDGVAAITVIMYVNMVFVAILIGFSIGTAPIIGFNFGAQNHAELQNMFKKCVTVVCTVSVIMTALAEAVAAPLVSVFLDSKSPLAAMTVEGFRYYSLSFLLCGINIFGSSLFTSLCNGKVSASISFMRALIMPLIMVFILPRLFGLPGIWLSIVAAELVSAAVTVSLIFINRKKYRYA